MRPRLASLRGLFPLLAVTFLPIARTLNLWLRVCLGARPRAWDGTGHYAVAQIYNQTIFPDTFGWTHAYFGGMPFPNFYPPLFYWSVALLHHTYLVSFVTAFKLMTALPVLLLPAVLWMLAWAVSDKNRLVATAAAFAIIPVLIDYRLYRPIGLDYLSTFVIGLYTQPLGFILLIVWYIVYIDAHRQRWRFVLSCLLLALTVLANFFNAVTASLFVTTTLITDLVKYSKTTEKGARDESRSRFLTHLLSPFVAASLTLFWLMPVLGAYDYFVTRPHIVPLKEMVSPAMWAWYAISVFGSLCWLRRPTSAMWPFLTTCLILAAGVIFAGTVAPSWFPLQTTRFATTFNFLLAVPVGQAISVLFERLSAKCGAKTFFRIPITTCIVTLLIMLIFIFIKTPYYSLAFYRTDNREKIDGVLRFAEQHRDGRYLVEVPALSQSEASFDGRALTSYLGAQGNEAVSIVFREASPSALFFNPLVNAFSASPDSFGLSSVLADDLDFIEQPLAKHLERARMIGVKYLAITSTGIRERLSKEEAIGARYELGPWSVFELKGEPVARVRALAYRPALVVSNFSVKQKRRNEHDFIRLAEEQFAAGWFDVHLVRSPESKIDRLQDPDRFGALILDTYECDNEDLTFNRLRDFAQRRLLVLLSSDEALFYRIKNAISSFPLAKIIERLPEEPGELLKAEAPSFRYQSSAIRKEWEEIKRNLDQHKIATTVVATSVSGEINQNTIQIYLNGSLSGDSVPVLIGTTYHPNWHRNDGDTVYAATPFFMLTFIHQSTSLIYDRYWLDYVGLLVSSLTVIFLCCFTGWHYYHRRRDTQK